MLIVLAWVTAFPLSAGAELKERGDLFVSFDGRLWPKALPRQKAAPIGIRVGGTVRSLSGDRPPSLRRISIALNRSGVIDSRGLSVCPLAAIAAASDSEALDRCHAALVGTGRYRAQTAFPEQVAFPTDGRILAFNGRLDGAPAILAHVYARDPAPTSRVIVFRSHQTNGAFGTVFVGSLPASLNPYGYLQTISLSLRRTFSYRGRVHSYLSAACGAPPGFPSAVFPFARTSMTFSDGRRLAATLTRSCRVRESGNHQAGPRP